MTNQFDAKRSLEELKGPGRFSHWLLWTCFTAIASFLIWANWAEIDEVTHSEGKVIPSQRVQLIQNLEGGIIKEILVNEGDIVEKGQILAYLDDVRFASSYKESKLKEDALEAKLLRLHAQVHKEPFEPNPELLKSVPQVVRSERALFESKVHEMKMLEENLALLQKEISMTEPLIKTGAVSEVEVIRLQQSLSETKGKISSAKSSAIDELSETEAEYTSIRESNLALKDRLERTTVRSPVKGIVTQIHVNTVGGVIRPGMDLMEIVPLDTTLLVEGKVRPSDIGFIHKGQHAMVKISAFDFAIYGGLEGQVEHISADTKIDENDQKKESFYEIWVRTQKNYLGTDEKPLRIIPGMTSTVDILTGRKTVMDYILKPIMKARYRALRER